MVDFVYEVLHSDGVKMSDSDYSYLVEDDYLEINVNGVRRIENFVEDALGIVSNMVGS